jgi:hypothetical protein
LSLIIKQKYFVRVSSLFFIFIKHYLIKNYNWELCPEDTVNEPGAIEKFWEKALSNLRAARLKSARRFNADRNPHSFKCGDKVVYKLNLMSSKVKRTSAKMLLKWSKPVVTVRFLTPNVVQLANPETGVILRKAHVSQIKL